MNSRAAIVRTLIADDEPIARAGLRRLLANVPWIEVIGEAASGPAALAAIDATTPDLVFLDIQMPGFAGTEVMARLTHQPFVVFTTAFAEHAVHAFELGAVDYLLKPFGAERLAAALERVRAALGAPADVPSLDRMGEVLGARPVQRVFVRNAGTIVPVPVSTVLWFESDGDYVIAQTAQRRHVLTLSLAALESRLDAKRFVRIHRTHIVNLDHVLAFKSHGRGGMSAEMAGGARLPVSRTRAQELRKLGV